MGKHRLFRPLPEQEQELFQNPGIKDCLNVDIYSNKFLYYLDYLLIYLHAIIAWDLFCAKTGLISDLQTHS